MKLFDYQHWICQLLSQSGCRIKYLRKPCCSRINMSVLQQQFRQSLCIALLQEAQSHRRSLHLLSVINPSLTPSLFSRVFTIFVFYHFPQQLSLRPPAFLISLHLCIFSKLYNLFSLQQSYQKSPCNTLSPFTCPTYFFSFPRLPLALYFSSLLLHSLILSHTYFPELDFVSWTAGPL